MLGGLYGDLPPPSAAGDDESSGLSLNGALGASAWSANKLAPSNVRKPSFFAPPTSVLRNQGSATKPKAAAAAPAVVQGLLAASRWTSDDVPATLERPHSPPAIHHGAALVGVSSRVLEEYDPARPNDYDEYCRERRRRKVEEEMRMEVERRRQEEEEREEAMRQREGEVERERERERERESEREKEQGPEQRAAALRISGEEAWKRRAMLSAARESQSPSPSPARARSPSPPKSGEGFSSSGSKQSSMTAAQRMMARMGWKEGQGLGKQEQGITVPLMARKTDKRAGVIVNAAQSAAVLEKKQAVKGVSISGPPTRVVLLRNMVGPGEVDSELEDEISSECSKYGNVTRVLIFEITEPNFPATEAVRIFVQFERSEQTTKALVDLDGRFFGGRVVRASFYDEDRFNRNDLAPSPGEVPAALPES